jgi:threonine dehydratase
MFDLNEVRAAAERIGGAVHRTPLLSSATLGGRVGVRAFLKCECFQKTGSFKARGALNKVLSLPASDRKRGIVTCSAGNHAQAVAWAARIVGAPCVVVMPDDAPRAKVEAVRGYAAEIVFHDNRDTIFVKLAEVRDARGLAFIHPFDDPVVLAGAGTAGLEIVEQLPDVDVVLVPVGGGGLMGGVTVAVKALRPSARVIAVELAAGPGLAPALAAGKPVPAPRPAGTLADGMTPPFVGALPLEIARAHGVELQTVTEHEIAQAMLLIANRAKLFAEGSGAATTACLLSGRLALPPDSKVALIVSGGNVDPERFAAVLTT